MSSAFILPQTKLCTWSKALVMVFTLASITVLPWSQRGKYGFGTPKPSFHWQLLAIGNSDRQGGGPLHLASPPCPPCEPFQRHPQMPPTWEISSLTCQALLATVSMTGLRRGLFSTVLEGKWDYCGHNAAGARFSYGKIWCAKCVPHCASPYRGSLVIGYEMVWCLLCLYGPAFGIRSAPYIFTCIADLVEWVTKQNYSVNLLIHYLDDFYTLGPPGSSVSQHSLDRFVDCFCKLGIPSIQKNKKDCQRA